MFCDVMQSVSNPNNCLLKVSLPRIDEEDYEEYRLTTAKVEKLSRSLRPFTRIERFALDVSNCSAAAVETLFTSVTRATFKELDLQGITLTLGVATALCHSLPKMSSLEHFKLTGVYRCGLQADKMEMLSGEFMETMPLKALTLKAFTLKALFESCYLASSTIVHFSVNMKPSGLSDGNFDEELESLFQS